MGSPDQQGAYNLRPPPWNPSPPTPLTPELERIQREAIKVLSLLGYLARERLSPHELPGRLDELKEQAFLRLSDLLSWVGELHLEVAPHELRHLGHPIFSCEQAGLSFAADLYRAGVREVTLLQGLHLWELSEFVGLLGGGTAFDRAAGRDAVTLFWEKDWPHIQPTVLDPFQARVLAPPPPTLPGDDEEIPPLPGLATGTEHATRELLEALFETTCMEMSGGERGELLALVDDVQPDLWRRGFSLAVGLIREKGSDDPITRGLVELGQLLLDKGRWNELSFLGQQLRWALGRDAPAADQWRARSLRLALGELLDGGRVGSLARAVTNANLAMFQRLGRLLLVLPPGANPALLELHDELEDGEVAFHLLAILMLRGADVEDLFRRRLGSGGEARVLQAIRGMGELQSRALVTLLSPNLCHPSVRVRRVALAELGPRVGADAVPHLVRLLELAPAAQRSEVIGLLEALALRPVGKGLLPYIKKEAFWDLGAQERARLVRLLVRSGDAEGATYLTRQIVKVNLSVSGRTADADREQLVRAVVSAGGDRARKILLQCQEQMLLPGIRAMVIQAMGRVADDPLDD